MAVDGNYDGKFKITAGQGLSQAIKNELGLTQDECNKLGKSIWTEIFKKVDEQNAKNKIYDGGNNAFGDTGSNYVVHAGQEIKFSQEIWNGIVDLVNTKLGKDIAKLGANPPVDPEVGHKRQEGGKEEVLAATPDVAGSLEKTGEEIAKNLKTELQSKWVKQGKTKEILEQIKKGNIAYVLNSYEADNSSIADDIDNVFGVGTGFDKDDVYEYVLKPFMQRAKELGVTVRYNHPDGNIATEENLENASLNLMKTVIKNNKNLLLEAEKKIGENIASRFNSACNILNNLAENGIPDDTEIKRGVNDAGEPWAEISLDDNRWVQVWYDLNGQELQRIDISTEKDGNNSAEICFKPQKASYEDGIDPASFDGNIDATNSDYNWKEIKAVAERIFGKNPPAADPNPPTDHSDLTSLTTLTVPSRANKTVLIGEISVEYDNEGRATKFYDKNGNETRCATFDENGVINFYEDYEYDENGKRTRTIYRDADGSINFYNDYEYDENGNETRAVERKADGSIDLYRDFEYDENGNVTRAVTCNADGSIDFYRDFEYDENGNVTRGVNRNADGSLRE